MSKLIGFDRFRTSNDHHLPPGPSSRLRSTLRIAGDFPGAMDEWRRRYGPTFTVTDLVNKSVLTAEPELVRQVMSAPPGTFDCGVPEAVDVVLGERSLLFMEDEAHRDVRRLLTPSFCKSAVASWTETIMAIADQVYGNLEQGEAFGCRTLMEELTTRVIVRIVFGAGERDEAELIAATSEVMHAIDPIFIVARQAQRDYGRFSSYRRFKLAVEQLDRLLYRRIARARDEAHELPNVLSALARGTSELQLSDTFIRDQLYTMLLAGYETTAFTLTWAAYYLLREPGALTRLRAEIEQSGAGDDPGKLVRLPYLGAVIDETLRLHPPSVYFNRRLAKPWTLGRWKLPAGVMISPAIYLIHRDEAIWGDDAGQFRPERFFERRPSPFEFLPFGGGSHRCLGAALAKTEAAIALGRLVSTHELDLREVGEVEFARISATWGPKQDIRMAVRGPARIEAPSVSVPSPSPAPAPAAGCPFH